MPIENTKIWKKNLKKAAIQYRERKLSQVRAVAFQAYREILLGSPVLTGRFRSNWMISLGAPSEFILPEDQLKPVAEGAPPDAEQIKSGNESIQQLGEELNTLYITNNLPYALRLEEGHSKKNQGFVKAARENARNRFRAIESLEVVG